MLKRTFFIGNLFLLSNLFSNEINLKSVNLVNKTAYIPSQCYTKTENDNKFYNPCFSCHSQNKEPNFIDDIDLQKEYSFPSIALKNPWTNLFKNRTEKISEISDKEILEYINSDNYKNKDGEIILKSKLEKLDKNWDGYVPDCYFNFDEEGFDVDNQGKLTGWRVFAYQPFLGTFWPTNGNMDDVIIRLPKPMMEDDNGNFSKEIYKINLAIVESMIKQMDIELDFEVDEKKYDVDLNHNGKFDKTSKIVFKWIVPDGLTNYPKVIYKNYYVGRAKKDLLENRVHISPGLYPNGTEFLHSVRYVGINQKENSIKLPPRMKELRYSKKMIWSNYTQLKKANSLEIKERQAFPDRTKTVSGDVQKGLFSGLGWVYQGFIEDKNGDLRPQTYEETLSCIGCHSGISVTTDSTFAFPRKFKKVDSWYHWSKKGFENIADLELDNGETEYIRYLKENRAGDEFRINEEIKNKFFDKDSNLKIFEIEKIKKDISYLIYPSTKRALELNKAYKIIVEEQSFIYGKDTHVYPVESVYKEVKEGMKTNLQKIIK